MFAVAKHQQKIEVSTFHLLFIHFFLLRLFICSIDSHHALINCQVSIFYCKKFQAIINVKQTTSIEKENIENTIEMR